jgi:hypothetical protein
MADVQINTRKKKKEISPYIGIYAISLSKINNLLFESIENISRFDEMSNTIGVFFNKENKVTSV